MPSFWEFMQVPSQQTSLKYKEKPLYCSPSLFPQVVSKQQSFHLKSIKLAISAHFGPHIGHTIEIACLHCKYLSLFAVQIKKKNVGLCHDLSTHNQSPGHVARDWGQSSNSPPHMCRHQILDPQGQQGRDAEPLIWLIHKFKQYIWVLYFPLLQIH